MSQCKYSQIISQYHKGYCQHVFPATYLKTETPYFRPIKSLYFSIYWIDVSRKMQLRKKPHPTVRWISVWWGLIIACASSCGAWKECTVRPCHLHHQCSSEAGERRQRHHIRVLQRRCGGGVYSKAINTIKKKKHSTVAPSGSTLCRC